MTRPILSRVNLVELLRLDLSRRATFCTALAEVPLLILERPERDAPGGANWVVSGLGGQPAQVRLTIVTAAARLQVLYDLS